MPRCPLIDAMIVDVIGDAVLVTREFIEVFRVEEYREFAGYYAVSISSLPEPLRRYIELYGEDIVREREAAGSAAPRRVDRRQGKPSARRVTQPQKPRRCASAGGSPTPRVPRKTEEKLARLIAAYYTP